VALNLGEDLVAQIERQPLRGLLGHERLHEREQAAHHRERHDQQRGVDQQRLGVGLVEPELVERLAEALNREALHLSGQL
jgi:hypothetical protein